MHLPAGAIPAQILGLKGNPRMLDENGYMVGRSPLHGSSVQIAATSLRSRRRAEVKAQANDPDKPGVDSGQDSGQDSATGAAPTESGAAAAEVM